MPFKLIFSMGIKGNTGSAAGVPYTFNSSWTAPSSSINGQMQYNQPSVYNSSYLYISKYDSSGRDLQPFIDDWDNYGNANKKGFLLITNSDSTKSHIVEITGTVSINGFYGVYTIPIQGSAYNSNTVSNFSNNEAIQIAFVSHGSTGDQGTSGAATNQGATGAQGTTGTQGKDGTGVNQGVKGDQGRQGRQGTGGIQGKDGFGLQGEDGVQGGIGQQGLFGPQGSKGIQGVDGVSYNQGATGAPGPQGASGLGLQGTDGTQGVSGTATNQGAQGTAGPAGGVTSALAIALAAAL